jgi:hypothetical protein
MVKKMFLLNYSEKYHFFLDDVKFGQTKKEKTQPKKV